MNMTLKEPANGEISHEGLAIVLFNHVGSHVGQDTGRDAQAYSTELGVPVLAVNRPGTGGMVWHPDLASQIATPIGYVKCMAKLGKKIDSQLETLGAKRAIVIGRSAGGLGALALTKTETVSVQTGVFAADPVACEPMTVKQGIKKFKDYNIFQKQLQDQDTEGKLVKPSNKPLPPLQAASRIASIVPSFYYDKFHNKRIWASDATVQYASYIAVSQPQIDATIEFAEYSLTATDEVYKNKLAILNSIRSNFVVRKSLGMTHASYDDYGYVSSVLKFVIARANR